MLKKEVADKLSVMCDMTELGAFRRPKILKETDSALSSTTTIGKIEEENRYLYTINSRIRRALMYDELLAFLQTRDARDE